MTHGGTRILATWALLAVVGCFKELPKAPRDAATADRSSGDASGGGQPDVLSLDGRGTAGETGRAGPSSDAADTGGNAGGGADAAPCPVRPAACANGAGTFCDSPMSVATCVADERGCVTLGARAACSMAKPCTGTYPLATCSCPAPPAACTAGAGNSCQGNALVTCALDASGCLTVSGMTACPAGKPCAGVAPNAACTCPTPPTACAGQASGSFCASPSTLATCNRDANGCIVTTPATACSSGCTGTHPGAKCCTPACDGKCGGPDSCGGTCPDKCAAPDTCGGAGTPNVCGSCVSQVSVSGGHSCARKHDGSLWCWGTNDYGQVGDGSQTDRSSPTKVAIMGNVVQIATGANHTCALKDDGSLWCWGFNVDGQVGDGTGITKLTPVHVAALGKEVVQVAAGSGTCARKRDGTLWCWGDNTSAQLGDGTTTKRLAPVRVLTLGDTVADVSVGISHTCARKMNGTVWCWGGNGRGQLGDGTTTNRPQPVEVTSLGATNVAIAAGMYHSCAVKRDGSLWCWGDNDAGQIGDGSTTARSSPVTPAGLGRDVATVAAGTAHTCAVKRDNTLWCWGKNGSGEIGDGSTRPRDLPVQVTGVGSTVGEVTAAYAHTCARNQAGVWCWGLNYNGELGDGTVAHKLVPTPVQLKCP